MFILQLLKMKKFGGRFVMLLYGIALCVILLVLEKDKTFWLRWRNVDYLTIHKTIRYFISRFSDGSVGYMPHICKNTPYSNDILFTQNQDRDVRWRLYLFFHHINRTSNLDNGPLVLSLVMHRVFLLVDQVQKRGLLKLILQFLLNTCMVY